MLKRLKSVLKGTQNNLKKQSLRKTIGNQAEILAKQFLLAKGLKFVQAQFNTPLGEIDLIMKDESELVFIEVRYRKQNNFGEGYETITHVKKQRLIRTALYFQQKHRWARDQACRFDIISISDGQLNPKITWIPNAFGVE